MSKRERPKRYRRLSQDEMVRIAQLSDSGSTYRDISSKTGVPYKTIVELFSARMKKHKEFWEGYHSSPPSVNPSFTPRESSEEHYDAVAYRDQLMNSVGKTLVYIPDTQVKSGVPTDHIAAAGLYIADHRPDYVVIAGDWWDMPSLNRFGTKLELDGLRVLEDVRAGKDAMRLFLGKFMHIPDYNPRVVYTVGNHDPQVRIPRVIEEMPNLKGLLVDDTTSWLEGLGVEVHEFLEIVNIEGIRFSHFFQNAHSAKRSPLSGNIDTMLKNAGWSFVQGHTQGLKVGKHYLSDKTKRIGIVAGSFYMHREAFMGRQGNEHWHGILHLNEVQDGGADVCELSLNYLLRKYGGQ